MIFKRSKVNKIIQDRKQKSRNKLAVECLLEIGFPAEKIRGGLMKMNDVTVPGLVKENPGLKAPTLYAAINGRRTNNTEAKEVTAHAIGLNVDEFYPPGEAIH